MSRQKKPAAQEGGVAAVDRALALLAAFAEGEGALTLADLARKTGLYKSTILRLAASLERAGYLRRLADGRYQLGPTLLQLGQCYQQSFKLEDYAMPVLQALAEVTGESVSLYVREGSTRVCLFRVNSLLHRVLHYVTPGTRLPLETGASGKVLRAFTAEDDTPELAKVRQELLVLSLQDRKSETAAIACPVFGVNGAFVGAMSLAGPSTRFDGAAASAMSEELLIAASALTRALGGKPSALEARRTRL